MACQIWMRIVVLKEKAYKCTSSLENGDKESLQYFADFPVLAEYGKPQKKVPSIKIDGTCLHKFLIGDTGVLNTLNQEVLAECVKNNQRRNDHKTIGVTNRSVVNLLRFRNCTLQ